VLKIGGKAIRMDIKEICVNMRNCIAKDRSPCDCDIIPPGSISCSDLRMIKQGMQNYKGHLSRMEKCFEAL
jgi:hypothetical protein